MVFLDVGVGHCGSGKCRSAWSGPYVLLPRSSTVEVAAGAPAVLLGAQLTLQLRQAPDPGAVGAEVGLHLGGESWTVARSTPSSWAHCLQRGRDRPAHVHVVPMPPPNQRIEHKREGIGSAA